MKDIIDFKGFYYEIFFHYEQVYDQAAEIGLLLSIPVIYASPPSTAFYVMGVRKVKIIGSHEDIRVV